MSIPREFIDLVLAKTDIVGLIGTYFPLRKKSAANYFACCPFHQEKNPSFSVSQSKQFYYCFGCGASGNAFDFLMNHDHLNFREAVEHLARLLGMELPAETDFKKSATPSVTHLYAFMVKITQHFYHEMRQSPRAIDYLKGRGITGVIAQQFQLGFAPPGQKLLPLFAQTAAEKQILLETGLIFKKENGSYSDRFRDRILFPIHDYRGRIIGFGGRILEHGEPKYLNSPETVLFQKGKELYGLYYALKANRKLDRILVVEGYMDVIALFQQGITYAAATLGTATTEAHLKLLFRYTQHIVFCFDGDIAGRKAAHRALETIFPLMHDELQIQFLFLPEADDPDSLIRREGKTAFENRLKQAPSLSTFFFESISSHLDASTMEGKSRFATQALQFIKNLPLGLFRSLMIEELAKRSRLDIKHLENQLNAHPNLHAVTAPAPQPPLSPPLRLAIALLLQSPKLVQHIHKPLPSLNMEGYGLLEQLVKLIQANPEIHTGAVIDRWRDHPDAQLMLTLAHWEHAIPDHGLDQEFKGTLQQLTLQSYDQAINQLMAKAACKPLTIEEKQKLNNWINQKKSLSFENF